MTITMIALCLNSFAILYDHKENRQTDRQHLN